MVHGVKDNQQVITVSKSDYLSAKSVNKCIKGFGTMA